MKSTFKPASSEGKTSVSSTIKKLLQITVLALTVLAAMGAKPAAAAPTGTNCDIEHGMSGSNIGGCADVVCHSFTDVVGGVLVTVNQKTDAFTGFVAAVCVGPTDNPPSCCVKNAPCAGVYRFQSAECGLAADAQTSFYNNTPSCTHLDGCE